MTSSNPPKPDDIPATDLPTQAPDQPGEAPSREPTPMPSPPSAPSKQPGEPVPTRGGPKAVSAAQR